MSRDPVTLIFTVRNEEASVDALLDSLFSGAIPRTEFLPSLELQQRRLQSALSAAANLDLAIGRVSAASVSDLQVMERVTAAITVALVLLAIVAAILVVRLGRQDQAVIERHAHGTVSSASAPRSAGARGP